mmetsp:Transcript_46699/g.91194  ORF Transcript_46699/g.91194 Transcript_46699/m.91194 type:complete len:83 (+) Transcript_46699:307-555(+)
MRESLTSRLGLRLFTAGYVDGSEDPIDIEPEGNDELMDIGRWFIKPSRDLINSSWDGSPEDLENIDILSWDNPEPSNPCCIS